MSTEALNQQSSSVHNPCRRVYEASYPKALQPTFCLRIQRLVWNLFCATILFPIGIVRLLNHYTIRPLLIKYLILPATRMYNKSSAVLHHKNAEMVYFKNGNGETVEAAFHQGKKYPDRLIIVNGGNGMDCVQYDHFETLLKSGVSILSINLQDVGKSEGILGTKGLDIEESLGLSIFNAYQFAREVLKFSEKHIVLYGLSMGGVATTLGASYIQEEYGKKAVKLINDRSLSSFEDIAIALALFIKKIFKKTSWSKLGLASKIIKRGAHLVPDCLVRLIIKIFVAITGIQTDAAKAFKKLRTKNKCVIFTKRDQVISYKGASLYKAVEKEGGFSRIKLRSKYHTHCSGYKKRESRYVIAHIYRYLGIEHKVCDLLEKSESIHDIYKRVRASA